MDILKHITLRFNKLIKRLIVGVTFVVPLSTVGQNNLIVNPNCDIYDTCPDNTKQIARCLGWWDYDAGGTPDYINECANHPRVGIPSDFGAQLPLSEGGYIHSGQISSHYPRNLMFWTGNEFGNMQSRESFGCTLTQELRTVPHRIEFYINFAKWGTVDLMGTGDGRVATNAFDIMLLNEKDTVFNSVAPYIDLNDVIKVYDGNEVINDTSNWVKLSTCFIPKGGEKFIVFGAFRDTNDIILEFSGNSHPDINFYGGSYYFDNFSLIECDTCCLGEFPYEDHVNVSNNPGSSGSPTILTVVLNGNTTAELSLYDSAGRLVARNEFAEMVSNYQLPIDLAQGIYHYAFHSSNGSKQFGKILVSP